MENCPTKNRIIARAPWWNYGWDGSYFITICTGDRHWYFGKVINSKMHLSKTGEIARDCWYTIVDHAKNVQLGEFVVMPNHVHGILTLENNNELIRTRIVRAKPTGKHPRFQNPGRNTISTIIGSYKSAVSKHAHRMTCSFSWQSRFHDHIIRSDEEYHRIARYIRNNPMNWPTNRFKLPNTVILPKPVRAIQK